MNTTTVPEFVISQSEVPDTEQNTVTNSHSNADCSSAVAISSKESSAKQNAERKGKEKKKVKNKERKRKIVEGNNSNSNSNNSSSNSNVMDSKSLEYTSNNGSSVTMETDGSKAVATNTTAGNNNTWAAIDTLDDVRQLAAETTDSDNFSDGQEKELNKMRQNQIKLLKLMASRNSRLQKVESPLEESNINNRVINTDNIVTPSISNTNVQECDRDACHHDTNLEESPPKQMEELLTTPTTTAKQEEDMLAENEKECPLPSSSRISNQESVYISDYFETLDDVQTITKMESEYIGQMEKIINDREAV